MNLLGLVIATAYAADPAPNVDLSGFDFTGSPTPGTIANNILHILVSLAFPLAFAALVWCAYILITSGGKPDAIGTVKKNVIYVVIGLALISFAVVMLRFVLGLLTFNT